MHDFADARGARERDELAAGLDRALECRTAVLEPDVVRIDEYLDAAKRICHRSRLPEVVRKAADAIAEPILRGVRREAPDLRTLDQPVGNRAADEPRRTSNQNPSGHCTAAFLR